MIDSISIHAVHAFLVIFLGYIIQTSVLQFYFYYFSAKSYNQWKIQPQTNKEHLGTFWGIPILSCKPNRGVYHRYLTIWNLFVASCSAAFTAECCARGWNQMRFDSVKDYNDILYILFEACIAMTYECIVEYYWHRLMHTKYCYGRFHKFHHFYKSPEPWDDMYIHPLEAFGYYCILYGPPFLFPIHQYGFLLYMVVMGLCGVLDHSGIRCEIPALYNTVDHDNHHAKFEVNYSFPFPYMDMLHGTYEGIWLGRQFHANHRKH